MNNQKLAKFFNSVKASVSKHSPEILTGIGIAGMITTTVLAVRATPKALKLIEEKKDELSVDKLKPIDTVKATWKCYIPATVTCVASTACLIGASRVNLKRNAALATAYKLSETALTEYKEKVVETIGEKKEQAVREKVAEERLSKNPVNDTQVIMTEKGNTLFLESVSGRYFRSDIEKIRHIVNDLNEGLLNDPFGYMSLNDLYDELGLEQTQQGDLLGWNTSKGIIKIDIHAKVATNGEPCIVLDYINPPIYKYDSIM